MVAREHRPRDVERHDDVHGHAAGGIGTFTPHRLQNGEDPEQEPARERERQCEAAAGSPHRREEGGALTDQLRKAPRPPALEKNERNHRHEDEEEERPRAASKEGRCRAHASTASGP